MVEIYPLVVACKMTGGLEVLLMDGVKTKNVILALLQLESRYNSISNISCDAGTNLINISETDKKQQVTKCEAELAKQSKKKLRRTKGTYL